MCLATLPVHGAEITVPVPGCYLWRERGREGRREGRREGEGGKERGREQGREGGREEGGREFERREMGINRGERVLRDRYSRYCYIYL